MSDQSTLDYIFFHSRPYQLFKQYLLSKQVKPLKEELDQTDVEGWLISIPDQLSDELSAEIEAYYDEMMVLSESLVAADEDDTMHNVGLAVSLQDGRSVLARVEPDVLNRILTVVSHQELGQLVDAIADAVENPDQRPLCKRY